MTTNAQAELHCRLRVMPIFVISSAVNFATNIATPDAGIADFRLEPQSLARAAGVTTSFNTLVDLEGKTRPVNGPLTLGALE